MMPLFIKKMTEKYAVDALCWKYEKPYDFYNNVLSGSAIMELLTYRYFAVVNEKNQLVGYFCIGKSAQIPSGDQQGIYSEDCIDVGIAMKPELTGKGNGYLFFSHILKYIMKLEKEKDIRLTVATFNQRAIHLYEKLGFVKLRKFKSDHIEYLLMKKEVNGQ